MGQEADRELKFLHDLDKGLNENLHTNFEVSTIFRGRLAAAFSKVLKLEAVQKFLQYFHCSFYDLGIRFENYLQ